VRFAAAIAMCLVAPPALAIDLPRPGEPVDVVRIIRSMSI
jgi:hypothetical protein